MLARLLCALSLLLLALCSPSSSSSSSSSPSSESQLQSESRSARRAGQANALEHKLGDSVTSKQSELDFFAGIDINGNGRISEAELFEVSAVQCSAVQFSSVQCRVE
jgi:hypothetical protein